MISSSSDPLFALAVIGLITVSLYALWLQINLWFTNRIIERMAIIKTFNEPNSSASGFGCLAIVLMIIMGVIVFGFLLSLNN